jgi:hypothetical protein
MKAHPLSLIDDNEDNSSQTYISTTKAKKSLKEDDVSTENTLKINKKYIFQEKPINLNNKTNKSNRQQKIVFDFKSKLIKDDISPSKKTSDNSIIKPGLIEEPNDETKKEDMPKNKTNEKINQDSNNAQKDKLSKNLIEKRDKKFSYHGKIYFALAISMLIYQYFSYIYLIELPIIERK